jgi:hypothetical protein
MLELSLAPVEIPRQRFAKESQPVPKTSRNSSETSANLTRSERPDPGEYLLLALLVALILGVIVLHVAHIHLP